MKNVLEDELVDRAVNGSDVERVLGYRNAYATTEQLLRLYKRGHKTAVLSSNKITDRFIELLDLSQSWNSYAPLYMNRTLNRKQVLRLIERFETVKSGDPEFLLRIYLFSNIPFSEALEKIAGIKEGWRILWEGDMFVDARLEDIAKILTETNPETAQMEESELHQEAFMYARGFLKKTFGVDSTA